MKQGSGQQRRGRSRGNGGRRHPSNRNHNLESNGPEGKVRGTAQQVLDKYLSLARDASSSGEHIAAEGFYQYAEHYQRLLNVEPAANSSPHPNQNQRDENRSQDSSDGKNKEAQAGAGKPVEPAKVANDKPVRAADTDKKTAGQTKSGDMVEEQSPENAPDNPGLVASA